MRYGACRGRSGAARRPGPPSDPPALQDSLLAAPIMLDLVLLTELCQRVSFCTDADPEPQGFHSVLSLLSFLFKAPLVPPGSPVVNALFRQRSCIENILRCASSCGVPLQAQMSTGGLCTGTLGTGGCGVAGLGSGPTKSRPFPQGLCGAPPTEPHASGAQDGAPWPQASGAYGCCLPCALQERTSANCPQWLYG